MSEYIRRGVGLKTFSTAVPRGAALAGEPGRLVSQRQYRIDRQWQHWD